jgi:hypothetical protein
MSQSLILIDALCSAYWEKKIKKKKKETAGGLFFPPRPDTPCWLCQVGFSQLLGAIIG